MYGEADAPWDHYPKHLPFSEVMNPLQVIRLFFGSGWPNDHRRDLKEWRYYVINAEYYQHRQGPSNLLFVYEQHVRLTEAAYLLLLNNKARWPRLEDVSEEVIEQEKRNWVYFPNNLSAKELANPYRALHKCFKQIRPQQYRSYLKEWLTAALDKKAGDEAMTAAEIMQVYRNLRKLYSATWLIHQRETDRTFTHQTWGQQAVLPQVVPVTGDEPLSPLKALAPQLKGRHQAAMKRITTLIVKRIPGVSLIYLVGRSEKPSIYYLLVVIHDSKNVLEHELVNKIEDHCRFLGTVFVFLKKAGAVSEALKSGDRFYHTLLHGSLHLFHAPDVPLLAAHPLDHKQWAAEAEKDWNRWGTQGKAFMQGATRYLDEGNYALALFSLHQAAESSLIGIVHAVLGYRPTVHNLPRMIKLTLLFTDEIKRSLQLHTTEGVQLFNLLQRGYSEARYKQEFSPDESSVRLLKDKVQALIGKIEQVYQQFMTSHTTQ